MKNKKCLGSFIQFTKAGTTQIQLVPVNRVFSVYQNSDATKTFIKFIGAKDGVEIVETLDDIFDQQNTTTSKDLKMVRVTSAELKGNPKVIYFTHHMKQIVQTSEGARIVFDDNHRDALAREDLATIYGYQSSTINLGMVLVTRSSDSKEFIEFTSQIKSILPLPDLNSPPTGSIITFAPTRDRMIVDEIPEDIFASMP